MACPKGTKQHGIRQELMLTARAKAPAANFSFQNPARFRELPPLVGKRDFRGIEALLPKGIQEAIKESLETS